MTQKEFDKLDKQEQIEMLKEVEEQFNVDLPIVEPEYDDEGNIKNQKEVDKSLKKVLPLALTIWNLSYTVIKDKCTKTMIYTNNFVNSLKKAKKLSKTMITDKEWNEIIDKTVKDREKRIKIKQVIKGNANLLNKRVQQTVKNGYKNGKSYVQVQKELQRQFGYSKAKAKSIAITERNYYKSSAQLEAIARCSEYVKKTWIHNPSKNPRDSHVHADGQVADKKGYFKVNGYKTLAPQHFGIANQDINCHCTMKIEIMEEKKMKEIKRREPKAEDVKVNKEEVKEEPKEPTTTEVKCIRRHLNNEYRRAIEVGEVITVKYDYAKYLKEIGVVE